MRSTRRVQKMFNDKSLTRQSFKDESNINNIMAQYEATGLITNINDAKPAYGDFSIVPDYREALDKVLAAEALFNSMPAAVQQKFNYDPAEFMDFATNPENIEEMRDIGIAKPKPPESTEIPDPTLPTSNEE